MIGVECPKCDGTGKQRNVSCTMNPCPHGRGGCMACPGPHVVLEIPNTENHGNFHAYDADGVDVTNAPYRVFADPGKIMWWCDYWRASGPSQIGACGIDMRVDDHPGCGWVARPTTTWKETT